MAPVNRVLPLLALVAALVSQSACSEESETWFALSGDLEAEVHDAAASMIRIRKKIPALNILSSPAAVKALGSTYGVNLFFPDGFEPAEASFPVEFSYRSNPNSLGGSVVAGGKVFSHDTKGTAEFTEFGDKVRVRFEFQVADKSENSSGRQLITVQGEAVCDNADIFN